MYPIEFHSQDASSALEFLLRSSATLPSKRFAVQLKSLTSMGFPAIAAMEAVDFCDGDVKKASEYLIDGPPPPKKQANTSKEELKKPSVGYDINVKQIWEDKDGFLANLWRFSCPLQLNGRYLNSKFVTCSLHCLICDKEMSIPENIRIPVCGDKECIRQYEDPQW